MAVGDAPLPAFFAIDGIRIGTANAGVKQTERADVTVFEIAEGSTCAGVFTRNAFCAAPVHIAKANLAATAPRYWLVNTGNANAGTGQAGFEAAQACIDALAEKTGVAADTILPFSTGVIGEPLPSAKIVASLDDALKGLGESRWADAGSAIMTTDTRPKGAIREISIAGKTVRICGLSKGAGMIKPNMATMLSYVGTDAGVSSELLQSMLNEANRLSFNRITIDGDTSTNDSAVIVATGRSGVDVDALTAEEQLQFQTVLTDIYTELAQLIVRDAEGANKFVAVEVSGAASESEAEMVAYTVAESPLVKTALYASDPNWGRILAAVGRAGVESLAVENVSIRINGVLIAEQGGRAASYTEEAGVEALTPADLLINIDLERGSDKATVWTSDLSHEYVTINAEYRT
ncbi:Arginine biosynthesis bifunctional protein ArgJ [BD1-7 clade bacterium]|uniref:Arginine biosynthesis bifunctional protein ArgJ n=1 Tax=BD1-7 clade bacterium TaxID=2029982 RepID=A0A5S9N2M3_9GAMM|nr:Arginine biosynthesis bifunctional protein ArgJ [BD1-7 clade bacterium]